MIPMVQLWEATLGDPGYPIARTSARLGNAFEQAFMQRGKSRITVANHAISPVKHEELTGIAG